MSSKMRSHDVVCGFREAKMLDDFPNYFRLFYDTTYLHSGQEKWIPSWKSFDHCYIPDEGSEDGGGETSASVKK